MSKVAIIAGYGSGISAAVGKKFGANGFKLALLARSKERLEAAVAELAKEGITAKAIPTDLSDAAAVRAAVATTQAELGPIDVIYWNPYGPAGSITAATPAEYSLNFGITVIGLSEAVQASQADLKANKGAVLVTGGGLSLENDAVVKLANDWGAATLAVSKAAQRKLVALLHQGLAADDIYVAEVLVTGAVRGTAFDPEGKSPLTAESIADAAWDLYTTRDPAVWFVTK